jgi:hypothetical protein
MFFAAYSSWLWFLRPSPLTLLEFRKFNTLSGPLLLSQFRPHITHIGSEPQSIGHEVVEWIEINVGEVLTCLVANRNSPLPFLGVNKLSPGTVWLSCFESFWGRDHLAAVKQ